MKCLIASVVLSLAIATPTLSGQQLRYPANWNFMNAQQQEIWNRLAPKKWLEMTPEEQSQWKETIGASSRQCNFDSDATSCRRNTS
jgi:hypothetical protein